MPKLLSSAFSYHAERQWMIADASQIGWAPGFWPASVHVESEKTGNTIRFDRLRDIKSGIGEFGGVIYTSPLLAIEVHVIND